MTNSASSKSKITTEHENISIKAIEAYRVKTYLRTRRLATVEQAIKFVQERGFDSPVCLPSDMLYGTRSHRAGGDNFHERPRVGLNRECGGLRVTYQ